MDDYWISNSTAQGVQKLGQSPHISVEDYDVAPLDIQFGVMDKLTVPDSLKGVLFNQNAPTQADLKAIDAATGQAPEMQLYAVLDAAKMPYVLTGLLEASGLEYQSLLQGMPQEELGEHSPYLVRLEHGNSFTRSLFTQSDHIRDLWGNELGIFVRSRADFASLRKHFRRFTRIQDTQGKWYFFRFWEGRILTSYFKHEQNNPASINLWFSGRNGLEIESFLTFGPRICSQVRRINELTSLEAKSAATASHKLQINEDVLQMWSNLSHFDFVESLQRSLFRVHGARDGSDREQFNAFISAQVYDAQKIGMTLEAAICDVVEAACLTKTRIVNFPPDMLELLHHKALPQLSRAKKLKLMATQLTEHKALA